MLTVYFTAFNRSFYPLQRTDIFSSDIYAYVRMCMYTY